MRIGISTAVAAIIFGSCIILFEPPLNPVAVASAPEPNPELAMIEPTHIPEPKKEVVLKDACVERVEQLPMSGYYHPDDRRLQENGVIVALKAARKLMLFSGGALMRDSHNEPFCWPIALAVGGIGDAGDKEREGDLRTPEGWFRTSDKSWSAFHGAILIHYPTIRHAELGLRDGLISRVEYRMIERAEDRSAVPPQDTELGGNILIHGGGSAVDWTAGCIALNNDYLRQLRVALPDGMRTWILILP